MGIKIWGIIREFGGGEKKRKERRGRRRKSTAKHFSSLTKILGEGWISNV